MTSSSCSLCSSTSLLPVSAFFSVAVYLSTRFVHFHSRLRCFRGVQGLHAPRLPPLFLYTHSVCTSSKFWFLGTPQCCVNIFTLSLCYVTGKWATWMCVPEPKVYKRKCFSFPKQHYYENVSLGDRGVGEGAIYALLANVNLGETFILIIIANTAYLICANHGFKYSTQ